MSKDYYKILGIDENASQAQVKSAYRVLAKKYHPDANQNDKVAEERFKEISEAYSVLNDSQKRQKYDQMRKMGAFGGNFQDFDFQDLGSMFGGKRAQSQSSRGFSFDGFGDIFSQFFGGQPHTQQRAGHAAKGKDLDTEIKISFDTALQGGKKQFTINSPKICPSCNGRGCVSCYGSGYVTAKKTLAVNIPKLSENNKVIRLKGQGEPGKNGGPAGDLLLKLVVEPHPEFERKGLDIYSNVTVDMVHAALGGKIKVKTIKGNTVELSVPAGTQPDKMLKLKGLGIENDGKKGDHYVVMKIKIPTHLNKKAKELLVKYAEASGLKI